MVRIVLSKLKYYINKLLQKHYLRIDRDYSFISKATVLGDTDLVIDVGANSGQYAKKIRKLNYLGKIVSIEPLSEAHSKLTKNSISDSYWQVLDRMAVGSNEGFTKINMSLNSVSSSMLEILPTHTLAAPESSYIAQEKVKITTISKIINELGITSKKILLKIDTQGFEYEVLCGALEAIDKIKFIEIELTVQELYRGQRLYIELLNMLNELKFNLISLEKSFEDQSNGTLLQFDAIFCKADHFESLFEVKED
jgi:FkbM family methyltransferase